MHFSHVSSSSLFVLALCLPLSAQTTVLAGTTSRSVSITRPYLHNIATAGDGSLWTALQNPDGQANTSDFALTRSTDGGKTWKGLWYYPTTNQKALGAIYIGDDCRTLHTVWTDGLNDGYLHLHYQTFDTATQKWIGSPIVIQPATSSIRWFPQDIQITPKGTLIVGASSGAGGGPNFTGQSTILFIKKLGETKFSAPIQVNNSTTTVKDIGRAPSMHVAGEVVHIIYRTKRSGSLSTVQWGFSYRAYDTAANKFLHTSDVHICPNDNNGVNGGLNLATALDVTGNLYCVYVSPNQLRMAYGAKGKTGTNSGWQDINIAADTGLLGGNSPSSAYTHFSIATGPGDDVHVIYSKLSQQHQTLYIQTFRQGLPLLKPPLNERVLKSTSAANSFLMVNGDNNVRKVSAPMVITSGTPSSNSTGIAWFFDVGGDPSRTAQLGIACSGSLAAVPGLRSTNQPQIGKQFTLQWDNLPTNSSFYLALDLSCLATPFDMGAMGAPSCFLYGALMIPVGPFPSPASGTFQLSATLPNDSNLLGTGVILQSVILAKGANPIGLLATNALGVFF